MTRVGEHWEGVPRLLSLGYSFVLSLCPPRLEGHRGQRVPFDPWLSGPWLWAFLFPAAPLVSLCLSVIFAGGLPNGAFRSQLNPHSPAQALCTSELRACVALSKVPQALWAHFSIEKQQDHPIRPLLR